LEEVILSKHEKDFSARKEVISDKQNFLFIQGKGNINKETGMCREEKIGI
jgi:hypothetical protein